MPEGSASELIDRIARLAKIRIGPEDVDYYSEEFQRIVEYFKVIESVRDSLPSGFRSDVASETLWEREDYAEGSQIIDKILREAPEHSGNMYQVPRIIE